MGRFIPNENTKILFTTVAPGALATPDAATSATETTGGVLVAASYKYRVVALNSGGHSLPSPEVTQVVPSGTATNTVTLTLPAVTGETDGFDIYGRTDSGSPGMQKIGHVAHATTTFVDTGEVVPFGTLPDENDSSDLQNPSLASDWDNGIDLTDLTMSFNASAAGNAVPTPSFSTLFETSIIGTSQATFTADFYRDDEEDLAWETLTRGTLGFFLVRRYGGEPVEGDEIEVWPVAILSRAMANMANNTVVSFTVTCAVPKEPAESAILGA